MATQLTTLWLKVMWPPAGPTGALALAIDALSGAHRHDGWIELADLDTGEPLRSVNRACRVEGMKAILLAEATAPIPPDAPYARLWNRTEELAAQLNAWQDGLMPFPALEARDLIRLP